MFEATKVLVVCFSRSYDGKRAEDEKNEYDITLKNHRTWKLPSGCN